jgi:sugar lactone lactonase YvrE
MLVACEPGTAPPDNDPSMLRSTNVSLVSAGLAEATVFATGLEFPRGFTFGPDGTLYVAEAGRAGTNTTTPEECDQLPAPLGPYSNGPTGRISTIDSHGSRTTFAKGFPSAINGFGDVQGVADVAFVEDKFYALVAGGGCSHASADVPAGIFRVRRNGSYVLETDLSAWQHAHPVKNPSQNPADFEPDGSWYSMIAFSDCIVAVEPNHGEIVRLNPRNRRLSRIADISATQGHIVPTAVVERRGALYLSSLGVFPVVPGLEKIFRVSRTGEISVVAEGFTTVLGLDFDGSGRLYVLESSSVAGFPTPGTGRVVRIGLHGHRQVIVDGLFLPTAMRFGPDHLLYISNKGFGPPQPGEILRVDVHATTDLAPDEDMEPAGTEVAVRGGR